MKKRFLSILTALALCLTLLPTSALAEGMEAPAETTADCPFTITKSDGAAATQGTDYEWTSTVNGGGTVNWLTIKTSENLTIKNKPEHSTATATIVAGKNESNQQIDLDLTLNNVTITGEGSNPALSTTGTLNITLQGDNTLKGCSSGGNGIFANTLTINGPGTLQAQGTSNKNGIEIMESVTITGGTVTATGGDSNGAGISFSGQESNRTVIISGGNVTAKGGGNGMGIRAGGGSGNSTTTFSTGNNGNAIIHVSSFGDGITKASQLSGIIFEGNAGSVYGEQALGENFTIANGETLTIPSGAKLTVPANKTLTVENGGTLTLEGTLAGEGTITPKLTNTLTRGDFTYTAPADLTYNEQAKTATVTAKNTTGFGAVTVKYQTGSSEATTEAPTEVGTYKVLVSVAEGNMYAATTADIEVGEFTITPAAPTTYTVTFNSNGGSAVANQTITSGGKVTKPTDPTKTGFTFGGWYKEEACTNAWKFDTDTVTTNTTLYAQWTANPVTPTEFTVKFDSQGGSAVPSQTVEEGKTATEPAEPTMRGWRFRGWYLNGELYNFGTPVTGNITLVAKWSGGNSGGGNGGGNESDTGNSGNGNSGVTEKNPDGSTTTTTEKKDGTVIEETQHPDGTEVTVETKPDGTVTEETKRPDGSTTVIEKQPDGTVTTTDKDKEGNKTEVVEKPDGSSTTTIEKVDGTITITVVEPDGTVISQVELTKKALEGKETVEIPMPALPTSNDRESAPVVTLAVPKGVSVKVEVPVENPTPGTVAIIVHEDGREEIIKSSIATDNGVALTIAGSTTVKIVDNSKDFQDVAPTSWAADSVDFVTARELFSGISETDFAPAAPMTRQMLMTVLARLDGVDTTADPYGLGMTWAVGKNISDGSDPTGTISREELAVMLWRYAGSPMLMDYEGLDQFTDVADLALWAQQAMVWAHAEGIITGTTDTTLDPQGEATRAHVAAMIQRYCEGK